MPTGPAAAPSPADLQRKADAYVQKFESIFPDVTDYWKCGNAASTLLDYFKLGGKITKPDFIPQKHQWFVKKFPAWFDGTGNLWFDDYLWWSIVALKNAANGLSAPWDEIFKITWKNAQLSRTVWQPGGKFPQYQPLYQNGVWNALWGPQGPWVNNSWNKGNEDDLWGIQNAVVNLLYLNAAARTAYFDPQFVQIALDEYNFVSAWFKFGIPDYSLLYDFFTQFGQACALVRERVSTFHDEKTRDPHYNPKFYWTGDQGLWLGAAMHLMGINNIPENVKNDCNDLALKVLRGVSQELVQAGELQPYMPGVPVPQNDVQDYNSGTGVYLRYALEAWGWPDLKAELHRIGFDALILAMAAKVPDPPPEKIEPKKVNGFLNEWTNRLATLLAAIAILQRPA